MRLQKFLGGVALGLLLCLAACSCCGPSSKLDVLAEYHDELEARGGSFDNVVVSSHYSEHREIVTSFPYEIHFPALEVMERIQNYQGVLRPSLVEREQEQLIEFCDAGGVVVSSMAVDTKSSFAERDRVLYTCSTPTGGSASAVVRAFDIDAKSLLWSVFLNCERGRTYIRFVNDLVILLVDSSDLEFYSFERDSGIKVGHRLRQGRHRLGPRSQIVAVVSSDDRRSQLRVQNILKAGAPIICGQFAFFIVLEDLYHLAYKALERDAENHPYDVSICFGRRGVELTSWASPVFDQHDYLAKPELAFRQVRTFKANSSPED